MKVRVIRINLGDESRPISKNFNKRNLYVSLRTNIHLNFINKKVEKNNGKRYFLIFKFTLATNEFIKVKLEN